MQSSKRSKIKVAVAGPSDAKQDEDHTRKAVEEDRMLFLQATIVRIMKTRKELSHVILVQEVIENSRTRFQPQMNKIKKCIEHLIEKQYIERSSIQRDSYLYIN